MRYLVGLMILGLAACSSRELPPAQRVDAGRVDDGGAMRCSRCVPQCSWDGASTECTGYAFCAECRTECTTTREWLPYCAAGRARCWRPGDPAAVTPDCVPR